MSFDPVPGMFHIDGSALPARFDPSTWLVMASVDPDDTQLVDPHREYAVRFESAVSDGGSVSGFATWLRDENEAVYAVRLKSLLDAERGRAQ